MMGTCLSEDFSFSLILIAASMPLVSGRTASMRKLAYSVILNDGYEGGELSIRISDDQQLKDPEIGSMVVFPAYILHSILPVTKNVRYALVGWVHGPSFR